MNIFSEKNDNDKLNHWSSFPSSSSSSSMFLSSPSSNPFLNDDDDDYQFNFDQKENKEDEYSIIDKIQENNKDCFIHPILYDNDHLQYPINKYASVINILLFISFIKKDYFLDHIDEIDDIFKEAIDISNVVYFKFLSHLDVLKLRISMINIIDQSTSIKDVYTDQNLDDDESVNKSIIIDDYFIKQKIRNIIDFNDKMPEIEIHDFLNMIKQYSSTTIHALDSMIRINNFLIDDEYCLIKKKIQLLRGIFRNNESEATTLTNLLIQINHFDHYHAVETISKKISIPKSVWHMFHAMDISFLIAMLIWIEKSINQNPHNVILESRCLLVYLKEKLMLNSPKIYFVNHQETPNIQNAPDIVKLERNVENNLNSLTKMIKYIDQTKACDDCKTCGIKINFIMNSTDVPKILCSSELKNCKLSDKLGGLKRKIHNLNKTTKKKHNSGYSKEASAVAPVFKQILSLIGTLSNLYYHNNININQKGKVCKKIMKKPHDSIHDVTKEIVDLKNFQKCFNDRSDLYLPRKISDIYSFSVNSLDLKDIILNERYQSFLVTFNNNINNKTILSIHKIYIGKRKKYEFLITDFFIKNEKKENSVGIYIICKTIEQIIHYFKTSIYNNKKFSSDIFLLSFNASDCDAMVDYLNHLITF